MKAIDWRQDQALLKSETLSVDGAVIYMLLSGRNAWHSTWITRYARNVTFYCTLDEAKREAERRRKQGSVFYIRQVPVLLLRTTEGRAVHAEFHSRQCFGQWKVDEGKQLLRIGTPLSALLAGLGPHSSLWRPPRISEHSFVSVRVNLLDQPSRMTRSRPFKQWKSFSSGPKFRLRWVEHSQEYNRAGVNRIVRCFEEVNTIEDRTAALNRLQEARNAAIDREIAKWDDFIDESKP